MERLGDRMKRVFLIPNAITAFGLSCGLFVIFKTCLADPAHDLFSILQASAILLLIAAIADLADGAIARWVGAESEFGGQFDSLSDSVTFGVAPPLLILKSLSGGDLGRFLSFCVIIASMLYTLCGVLRLVRYNVRNKVVKESANQLDVQQEKKHFTGLPIPAAASAAVSSALLLMSPLFSQFGWSLQTRAWILIALQLIIGYFMVSRWKFPSAKALHFRVPSIYLVFVTGICAVLFLYGILDFFAEVYFLVSWLYLLIGWSLSIIRRIRGRRLADFELEEQEE
jgi:CDP-diacylglycerol---serine O-phosphatidyltransferase